jgi:hypothetical protein
MTLKESVENDSAKTLVPTTHQDVPGQTLLPAVVESVLGSLGRAGLHNFDGDRMQVWKMASLATGPACHSVQDIPAGGILLKYFYAHRIELVDTKDGQINDVCRCVIITPENIAYAFISEGIARDLAQIISTFGLKAYDPPIPVGVQLVKTRRGFMTYRLVPTE